MSADRVHIGVLLTSVLVSCCYAYNSYMLIFPSSVRPGMDFAVQLSLLEQFKDLKVVVEITTKNTSIAQGTASLSGSLDKPFIFRMSIPSGLKSDSYTLTVTGTSPDAAKSFKNSTSLNFNPKSHSLFVQTDKAIYKPGQKVQFRAFAVNAFLKPLIEAMDIEIYDSNNNKIAQWLGVEGGSYGVIQGDLQLSDQPLLGDWKIKVEYKEPESLSKSIGFTVAEYVLPKFESTVNVPSFVVISHEYLAGTVRAKYTFGKGVEGNGTVTIRRPNSRDTDSKHTLEFKIDGKYDFQIDMKKLKEMFRLYNGMMLEVFVEVEERLTGNTMNVTEEVKFYDKEAKLTFLESPDNFKPGLKYTAYLFLSDQDDKPLGLLDGQVTITVTMYYKTKPVVDKLDVHGIKLIAEDPTNRIWPINPPTRQPIPVEQKETIGPKLVNVPTNGIVPFSFEAPVYIERIEMKGEHNNLTASKSLSKFQSTSKTYIQSILLTKEPKVGRKLEFEIRSTVSNMQVSYMIVSKGLIVQHGSFFMAEKQKTLNINKTPSEMAPKARCIVYWVRKDAEIIADSIEYNVQGLFGNRVDIDFQKKRAIPGSNMKIKIKAQKNSECSILTVDKSVLLLKSGNDITPAKRKVVYSDRCSRIEGENEGPVPDEIHNKIIGWVQVEDELALYDPAPVHPCGIKGPCLRSYFPLPVQAVDVADIFRESGLKVLTDAFLYDYKPPPIRQPFFNFGRNFRFGGFNDRMVFAAAPMARMPMLEAARFKKTSSPSPGAAGSQPRVRTLFPETWIYKNIKVGRRGRVTMRTVVPDTITSWIATAFAINNKTGLGVAPIPSNLQVYLNFFVRLDLPYSVVRGEQVILQANIFNLYDTPLSVEVELKKSNEFQNIIITRSPNRKSVLSLDSIDVIRSLEVPADGAVAVSFAIKPTELGNIDIEVSVTSARGGDRIRKQLLAVPEGIPQEYSLPILIDMRNETNLKSFSTSRNITLPDDVVDGSVRVRITAIGDLMGPTISGLANLLRMPYGCGEQNMITLVPNIFVLTYLKAVKQTDAEIENKAKGFMLTGYQRELTYQHYDGSFSAFGNSDPSGSTWLTAFVVKSFAQASSFIYIDKAIVTKALLWIIRQYDDNTGTFKEPGKVIHKDMQGGSASGQTNLASYTVIALIEAVNAKFVETSMDKVNTIINKAVTSFEDEADKMEDMFEIAIRCYALVLKDSSKVDDLLEKLDKAATVKDGMKYWEPEKEEKTDALKWVPPQSQSKARNVETTAYVLLTYAENGDIVSGLKVLKWLIQQRNTNGGFGSTQDTAIAIQALSKFAARLHTAKFNLEIQVQDLDSFSHTFNIDNKNALVLQAVDAPPSTGRIEVDASGTGIALVDIGVHFNVFEDVVEPLFDLFILFSDENVNGFKIRTCFSWLGKNTSGMAVMEIGLLSGFSAEKFTVTDLSILMRKEENERMLILYFDEITSEKHCIEVRMQRTGLVVGSQPAVVKLYDYYEPKNHAFNLYQPEILKKTDVCDVAAESLGC